MRNEYGDDDGAPYVHVLSCRALISRKPRLCSYCDEPLAVGQKYTSTALLEEGKFRLLATHWGGCPKVLDAMSEGDAGVYEPLSLAHTEPSQGETPSNHTEESKP